MKKLWKRFGALFLCLVMTVTMLGGCGQSNEEHGNTEQSSTEQSSKEQSNNSGNEAQVNGEWTGEVSKIIMTYPTAGVEAADYKKVEAAINEYTIKKIGVEVELKPISIFEIPALCPTMIGGGDQIDLLCVAFTGLKPYVDLGMIEPLDQWMASAPYLENLAKSQPVFDTTSKDKVYGIMTLPSILGAGGGYIISVDDLTAAGLSYEDGQLITLDELDTIFEKIKAAKPDVYPCGVSGKLNYGYMTFERDTLGATAASGVLMGLDSTKVVNMYATEEYKEYLEHVRSWYEKGYILKDAAVAEVSVSELSRNGSISGYFSEGNAALRNSLELNTGKEYIHLMFNEPYIQSISAAAHSYWTIPVTAKEPEAAMRFLNLMYEEPFIANAFVWGVENEHYVFVDKEAGVITYPEGITQENTGYAYGLGLYGQQIDNYGMGQSSKAEDAAWNAKAVTRYTKGYGFCYDSSAMTNQIIAIEAVIAEYLPALETGSADLDTTYAEFIEKLEASGINEVIADKQAQFDAWLKQQ